MSGGHLRRAGRQTREVRRARSRGDTAEGHHPRRLLFPSTYYLMAGDGPTELIGAQLQAFNKKTASLPWEQGRRPRADALPDRHRGSLSRRRPASPDERAKVAAVIYNRLKKKMTLGLDATVRYAVDKWTGAAHRRGPRGGFAVQHPQVKGLPPTPICNPGVAATQGRARAGRWSTTSTTSSATPTGKHSSPPRTTSSCKLKKNARPVAASQSRRTLDVHGCQVDLSLRRNRLPSGSLHSSSRRIATGGGLDGERDRQHQQPDGRWWRSRASGRPLAVSPHAQCRLPSSGHRHGLPGLRRASGALRARRCGACGPSAFAGRNVTVPHKEAIVASARRGRRPRARIGCGQHGRQRAGQARRLQHRHERASPRRCRRSSPEGRGGPRLLRGRGRRRGARGRRRAYRKTARGRCSCLQPHSERAVARCARRRAAWGRRRCEAVAVDRAAAPAAAHATCSSTPLRWADGRSRTRRFLSIFSTAGQS